MRKVKNPRVLACVGFGVLIMGALPAQAVLTFGDLSNFDAVNDTGKACHGFRIELDGISVSDVLYTFGTPYNRYGDPIVSSFAGGVYVDYKATWDGTVWSTSTPNATTPIMTGGHQFWTGGDPNYPTGVPGDHFGLSLGANPTNTIYQWMSGDNTGRLNVSGSAINLPAPIVTAAPPVANPVAPAAVQVVVPAPDKAPGKMFGTPIWVKVYISENPNEPVPLEDLVVGNPAVSSEVEVEWFLLQDGYGGHESLDSGLNDIGLDAQSFVQRYEFYKYNPLAGFDEEGQALVDSPANKNNPLGSGKFYREQHRRGESGAGSRAFDAGASGGGVAGIAQAKTQRINAD